MFAYFFFRFVVFLFWLIPFWLLYGLSTFLYYIIFYIFRYRRKVVMGNLRLCFPEKSETELKQIERRFYRHLCDIILEGIKGFSMSEQQLLSRYKIHKTEWVNSEFYRKGRSFLALGSHCANWEWGAICVNLQFESPVVILFNPIKNQRINNYIKQSRELYRTYLRPIRNTKAVFEEFIAVPHLFIFIADQNPSNVKSAHWVRFLNRDTAMLHGAAKYAQQYDLPVVFFSTRRVRRGYYEVMPELLVEKPRELDAIEITRLYAQRLEEVIRQEPAHWLWSHRRWKHTRGGAGEREG